jgi:hypothetical protein
MPRLRDYIWHLQQVHAIQGRKICLGHLPAGSSGMTGQK